MDKTKEYKQKFKNFINDITKKDNIALFYDDDGDGICAAALAKKALVKLGYNVKLEIGVGSEEIIISDKTISLLKEKNIKLLITFDKSVESGPEQIKKIEEFSRVLIFDHHTLGRDISSDRTLLIKPHFFSDLDKPGNYCTAKLSYDFFSELTNLEDYDWVAIIGMLHDMGEEAFPEFIKKVKQKYNIKGELRDSKIGKAEGYISYTALYDKTKHKDSMKILQESKSYKDVLNSKIKKYFTAVDNEIKEHIVAAKKRVEIIGDVAFYKIKPKYSISSPLSTIINIYHYPDKTFVTITDKGNKDEMFRVSFRRNDEKKDMVKLIKEANKGLEKASGGGHKPAAGARIMKKNLEEFKKRIIEINKTL